MDKNNDNNNDRVPELRFPGFTGEWVVKKLGEILCERRESSVITEELPQLSFTIESGVIRPEDRKTNKRDFLMKDKDNKKFLITRKHDIIYNPANVVFGAIHKNNLCDGVVSPIYKIFWTNENADVLNYILRRPQFISTMATHAEGTVTKLKTLKSEAFLDLSILLPPTLAEQQKIAECLSSLDEEIAAEAQKVDALKDHKKGLMQQLFPAMSNEQLAMSNCVPELRFPGFEGEWVVKKFDELFSLLSNNTCSRADLNESNGIAVNIHYGDVLIKYNEILNIQDTKIPFITESKLVSKYKDSILRDGDIIIADTAEDSTVGKCTEIQNRQQTIILSGLHTIPARPLRKFAKGFLGYIMNSESYHDQLLPLMQGAKVSSISRTAIKKTFICFPTLAEQQKIADCLSELDEMISAQQQKVEALKEHKKGLMQKLFPKISN